MIFSSTSHLLYRLVTIHRTVKQYVSLSIPNQGLIANVSLPFYDEFK